MNNNRYFSSYPNINPSYLSSGTSQAGDAYTFEDIVSPNVNARRTNIAVQSNIDFDVFKSIKNVLLPIPTSNFNVIKLSVDTKLYEIDNETLINDNNGTIFVDILQGETQNVMEVSYTTPIQTNSVFYRNYPVKNNFCNVRFRNNLGEKINISYELTLSKFTQFNPPSQIGDKVEFAEMSDLVRHGSNFYDDVSRDKFANSNIINTFGFCKNNVTTSQIIAPVDIQENTSNTFVFAYGVSDSALDTGYEIELSGHSTAGSNGRFTSGINLNGLSPSVQTLESYKYIDVVDFKGNNNTGNISIYKSGTTDHIAYIPSGFANLSSPIHYINELEEAVLKEVRLSGSTIMQNGEVEVKLNTGLSTKTIWTSGLVDGVAENLWCPDYKIPSNSTVYGIIKGVNMSTYSSGDERIDLSLKLLKYKTKPVTSII